MTITGTDIIISSCLRLGLATPVINRERQLNNRRVKRKGKEELFLAQIDFQRRQKTQIQVAAKQEVCKNYKGIATQKRYNQESINLLSDSTILVLVGKVKKFEFHVVWQEAKEWVNISRQLQKHLC